ncbi:hydantoinase/oxoprolinase family protein [Nocardioides sp. NPDC051685]|uniref:hydantoinase/oxoprolinase family protein n=1 Tax=Nocardioides sp. NPDC051685 TaxID=3364334 RepID=UPI00379B44DA
MQNRDATAPRIGVDIGGTFTDLAAIDDAGRLHVSKHLTTHGAEQRAVVAALEDVDVDLSRPDGIVSHGSTLVINALLERHGSRAALVTTRGFGDVLHLRRGGRPAGFDIRYRPDSPLIPRELIFEVDERSASSGEVLRAPDPDELDRLADTLADLAVESVAIAFLNSYVAPDNERTVAEHLRRSLPKVHVTSSHELGRQWREYERTSSAAANAFVAPEVANYLDGLKDGMRAAGYAGELLLLDSSGGALSMSLAKRLPVRMVESGPVAGVIAAQTLARELELPNVVTFDMGGTTAKAALVENYRFASTDLYWINGRERGTPIQVPTVDIIEIGSGGGSIAAEDAGRLVVGPRSAGSDPGPASYGRGGTAPTITDANVYCGRVVPQRFLGSLELDAEAARLALESLAQRLDMSTTRLALGILKLGVLSMAAAVRQQTLERGHDPRDFTLIALGGAGPMHACDVAIENGIRQVLIPQHPGHFSAIGMLQTNLRMDRSIAIGRKLQDLDWPELQARLESEGADLLGELKEDAASLHGATPEVSYALVIRYSGQDHGVLVSDHGQSGLSMPTNPAEVFSSLFEKEYEYRFGHSIAGAPAELVEVQLVAEYPLPTTTLPVEQVVPAPAETIQSYFGLDETPVRSAVRARSSLAHGERLVGPAIVYEEGATTVVPPRAVVEVLPNGVLRIDLTDILEAGHE